MVTLKDSGEPVDLHTLSDHLNTRKKLDGIGGPGFLAEIAGAEVQRFPAVGSGEDLRLTGKTTTGAALVDGEHVVHLCAFRVA